MSVDPTVGARPKRRTFIVREQADRLYGCARCHRKLRSGERVTITKEGALVSVRHAGRTCPVVPRVRSEFVR